METFLLSQISYNTCIDACIKLWTTSLFEEMGDMLKDFLAKRNEDIKKLTFTCIYLQK